jgi:hypothetical protein
VILYATRTSSSSSADAVIGPTTGALSNVPFFIDLGAHSAVLTI